MHKNKQLSFSFYFDKNTENVTRSFKMKLLRLFNGCICDMRNMAKTFHIRFAFQQAVTLVKILGSFRKCYQRLVHT